MANPTNLSFSLLILLAAVSAAALIGAANASSSHHHHKSSASSPPKSPTSQSGGLFQLCRVTDYPAICAAAIRSVVGNGAASSNAAAVMATIQACKVKTVEAQNYASKLAQATHDAMTKACLKVCMESYSDAIDNLNKSVRNVQAKQKPDLNINLSAAMTNYETCDDSFSDNPSMVSPLAHYNQLLHKMTSNGLALATKMSK